MTFPGLNQGSEIFNELDKKIESISPERLHGDEIYHLAAFLTIISASCHAFPDANGRISVGLADIFLQNLLNRKIDYGKLNDRMDEFLKAMTVATYSLLHEEYNPTANREQMRKKKEKHRQVQIPRNSGLDRLKIRKFIDNFSTSIKQFIIDFNPKKLSDDPLSTYYHISKIANIYKEATIGSSIAI